MISRVLEQPLCFGMLHHYPLSTGPWYPGSSFDSASDLCALVYFSAQGAHHKTISSSFPGILVPLRLGLASCGPAPCHCLMIPSR